VSPQRRYNALSLNAYWFGVSFMWNAIHPLVLPITLLAFVGDDAKNTVYGMLTFIGLIIALFVQPVAGAMSDITAHRLGRRRPWMLVGGAACLVCLSMLFWARSLATVIASYLLLQVSSNIAHGPAQGLIPDLVPPGKRGAASGIKTLIDMSGVIAAALVMGRLLAGPRPSTLLAITVIGVTLASSLGITTLGTHELRPERRTGNLPLRRALQLALAAFRVDWRANKEYVHLLLSRFLMLLGAFMVQSFSLYYLRDVVQAADPAATMSRLMATIAVSITLIAYPAGVVSERLGRRAISAVACALAAVGMGALYLVQDPTAFWILGCVIGLAMGAFTSVNWAWATDMVPAKEAARFLGLSNLSTAGSAAAARLAGPLIDAINRWQPNAGYGVIFVLAAAGATAAALVTLSIPESQRVPVPDDAEVSGAPSSAGSSSGE